MSFLTLHLPVLCWSALANPTTMPPATPATQADRSTQTAAPVDPVSFAGYLEFSYSHQDTSKTFSDGVFNRVLDLTRNGGRWQQLALFVADQPKEGLGGLVNVTAGHDADVIASYGTGGLYNGDSKLYDVTQAYATYAKGSFTAVAGKFVTYAGEETIDSRGDWNFSRSILFGYAIPFSHTGLRLQCAPGGKATYSLGVNNGWDDFVDTNTAKTLELQTAVTLNPKDSVSAVLYSGKERVGGFVPAGPEGNRNLVDVVGTFKLNPKATFVGNYDYGRQDNASTVTPDASDHATWQGFAGYLHYAINDKWSATLRGEWFDDHNGYRTGIVQKWTEGTLTLSYTPCASTEVRLEGRSDSSNVAAFTSPDGSATKKTSTSFGGEILFKF